VTSIFYGEGERCPMSFADIEGEVYCDNIELVEPDIDDETEYHECPECGFSWGHKKASDATKVTGGSCQLGIPEEVRRAYSVLPEEKDGAVSLGSSIPLRPGL
jgi:hypothetical protein